MSGWLSRPASDTQITHGRRLWLYAVGGLVMLFLVIPSLIVIPMSFSDSQYLSFPPQAWSLRWYERLARKEGLVEAVMRRLRAWKLARKCGIRT